MKNRVLLTAAIALSSLTIAAGPEPMVWNVDAPHTGITFSVKHFFTPVDGRFENYDIELTYDHESPANSSVRASIEVASIDTNNERRDAHLLSEDFFEAETYPYITFVSESVEQVGPNQLIARGPLKIKGQVQDVALPIEILGVKDIPAEMQEMLGGVTTVASFAAGLQIERGDFNVGVGSWAADLVVGEEVDISIKLEANRK